MSRHFIRVDIFSHETFLSHLIALVMFDASEVDDEISRTRLSIEIVNFGAEASSNKSWASENLSAYSVWENPLAKGSSRSTWMKKLKFTLNQEISEKAFRNLSRKLRAALKLLIEWHF